MFAAIMVTAVTFMAASCTDISNRSLVADPFETDGTVAATQPPAVRTAPTEISVFGIPASRAAKTVFVGDTTAANVIDVRDLGGASVVPPEQIIANVALTPRNAANEYVHYGDSDMPVVEAIKLAAAAIRANLPVQTQTEPASAGGALSDIANIAGKITGGDASDAAAADVREPLTVALMFSPPDGESVSDYIYGYVEFIQIIKAAVSDVDIALIAPADAKRDYVIRLREAVSGIADFFE